MRELTGVLPVLPTPFNESDEVDLDGFASLVAWVATKGVSGIVVLGIAGEADKLVESERRAIVRTAAAAAAGRLLVVAGASAASTVACRANVENAAADGADVAMIAPSPHLRGDEAVVGYYASLGAGAALPIVVQDFPAATGVTMSAAAIARMSHEIDAVVGLKLEEAPTLPKLSAVLRLTDRLPVFGGLGGVFLIEELARGASGVMTGFAFPEVLRDVYAAFASGERDRAREIFNRFLPLILYESQAGPSLLIRKEIYRLRGLIASNRMRAPSAALDDQASEELQRVARTVGLSFSPALAVEPREAIHDEAA